MNMGSSYKKENREETRLHGDQIAVDKIVDCTEYERWRLQYHKHYACYFSSHKCYFWKVFSMKKKIEITLNRCSMDFEVAMIMNSFNHNYCTFIS